MKAIKSLISGLIIFLSVSSVMSQDKVWRDIISSAYFDNSSYEFLRRVCDEAGARMMGTAQNDKALKILQNELKNIGVPFKLESFDAVAWYPGEHSLLVTEPYRKKLKASPATQSVTLPKVEGPVVYADYGFKSDYAKIDARDKIVLVTAETPKDDRRLRNMEAIEIAHEQGAKAIVFHHRSPGGLSFSTSGNYYGIPLEIPAFTTTYEEGRWICRLLERDIPVSIEAEVSSILEEVVSNNIVVTFPGKVKDKIVIGCHFDSPELGQGASDNGSGSAVAFEVARLLNTFSPDNYYTIDIVWFNGEETGLWGSKKYYEKHKDETIRAMINLDVVGSPTGFNTSGFNEYRPLLEKLVERLNGFELKEGVIESLGTNSDHVSFYVRGIPVLGMLSKRSYQGPSYHHELGDTFDKIYKKDLSDAAAILSILLYELANDTSINTYRRSEAEITEYCERFGIKNKLEREKEWPYSKK